MPLFPITTQLLPTSAGAVLHVAELDLQFLAAEFGTPLYLYDAATLDAAVTQYAEALAKHYPSEHGLTYAGKAFLCPALANWAQTRGLWVDCTGVGEIEIARAGSVAPERILVHGVNKSQADLIAAVRFCGTIVVDNLDELDRLIPLLAEKDSRQPDVWLRFRPGLAVDTHRHTKTGQEDSKFGMSREEILQAASRCRQNQIRLTGLHFHQGSQFIDPEPVATALESALDLLETLGATKDWALCPGGGWGVAYHEDDLPHPDIPTYVQILSELVAAGCKRRGLPLPRLQLEPGRSIVAQAGVALYTVGAVKHTGDRTWLLVDGGLADNPRPALYGARYTALPVLNPERPGAGRVWIAGPYCETGDILIHGLLLPEIEPGELIAVPVSGAYHLSMASNYNGARRPAVVWLENGTKRLIQTRELVADLHRRDRLFETTHRAIEENRELVPLSTDVDRRPLGFHKYHALGNDYIVIEPVEIDDGLLPNLTRKICNRHLGLGGDGVLWPSPDFGEDFKVRIHNPDGSEAETSGNGLRIFARYLLDHGRVGEQPFSIQTSAADVRAMILEKGRTVRLEMGAASFDSQVIPVAGPPRQVVQEDMLVGSRTFQFTAVSVGNPHCVIVQDEVSPEKARRWGPKIEIADLFPNRTNIQFVQVLDRQNIRIEIWERGAGYTLASGSSSCAAAAVTHHLGLTGSRVAVHMAGGVLQVEIDVDGEITLEGPVTKICQGELTPEFLTV